MPKRASNVLSLPFGVALLAVFALALCAMLRAPAPALAGAIDGWAYVGDLPDDWVTPDYDPTARAGHASMLADNGYVYAIGGAGSSGNLGHILAGSLGGAGG